MGIKRVVDVGFWTDEKVLEELSPEDRLFFLYLLTNPHSTMLGIYRIVPKQIAFEMGYSTETVKVLLDRFENKYGIIQYSHGTKELALKNYLHYGIVSGGKPVFDRLTADMKDVKDLSLLQFIYDSIKKRPPNNETVQNFVCSLEKYLSANHGNGNGNVNGDGNGNGNGESYHDSSDDSCHDSSKKSSHSIPYEAVKKLYNEICKSYSRCTIMSDMRKKAVRARFSSGYTLDDFKTLFEKAEASNFLKGNNNRDWKATIDWLIKDANMAKVLDGNYDDTKGGKTNETNAESDGASGQTQRYGIYL